MFSSGATVWHYLFALFNGTNGLILFLIFFYGRFQAFYRIRQTNNSNATTSSKLSTGSRDSQLRVEKEAGVGDEVNEVVEKKEQLEGGREGSLVNDGTTDEMGSVDN